MKYTPLGRRSIEGLLGAYCLLAGSAFAAGPAVPCAARADAVIANTGKVLSLEHSLVDSYNSALGSYWGSNIGANGTVRAGAAIIHGGGVIHGPEIANSPAGLAIVPVTPGARPLPLGSKTPGRLRIHGKHESITLRPGIYVAADIDLDSPGEIKVYPAGSVTIFVTGRLSLDGEANLNGHPSFLQFLVTGTREVHIGHRATVDALVYAPKSEVEVRGQVFGSVVGGEVKLHPGSGVHFDDSGVCQTTPLPTSPAIPPKPLPPLPAPTSGASGCYVNTRNGWKSVPCADNSVVDANFPHPDTQLTVSASAPGTPLQFGQIAVTVPQIASESNAFLASTAGIPNCTSSGAAVANQWSIQGNTNQWAVASGTNAGDTAQTQFVIQSNGSSNIICIWNIDVTAQDYTHKKCVSPDPPQRSGGLQAFDVGSIAAYVNSDGTLGMVAELSWVPSGTSSQYAITPFADTYGLASGWSLISGGILGLGSCSQAQFASAEVVTQIAVSNCVGDTQSTSTVCAPPTLQPNATATEGSVGTVETNNLTAIGSPTLAYLNSDLAVSNLTATTSGSCLGPSHAYVKDSPEDFGGVPSNIGNSVFWESPDIFLVPHGTPVDVNATSTETTITPNGVFDVYVRVHNDLGCASVTGAKTQVYLADPAALSVQWVSITGSNYVGNNGSSTGVTVPAGGQALIGPLTFTAPSVVPGDGHKCLLAAIEADGEAAPANTSDAPDSNQVAQRNLQFASPCVYPLTNGTSSNGTVQLTLTATPNTGTTPSLSALPDVEVAFDDADSSWFNVWNSQVGSGTAFSVTHNGGAGTTTVRLGAFSVAMNSVPLAAGQSRNATGTINPDTGTLTLQIGATFTESGGSVTVSNGGSCTASVPVIK